MNKTALRQKMLLQRRSLSSEAWRMESDRICQVLNADRSFKSAKTVLAYFSTQQELDLSGLWTERGKNSSDQTFGFPICDGNHLLWRSWTPGERLVTGNFGIQEPDRGASVICPEQVDLMLVPCVGCDRLGYRLGYGGGFYDRLLANPEWRSVPTVGILYDFAIVEKLPREHWDLPLHRICSGQGFLSLHDQS